VFIPSSNFWIMVSFSHFSFYENKQLEVSFQAFYCAISIFRQVCLETWMLETRNVLRIKNGMEWNGLRLEEAYLIFKDPFLICEISWSYLAVNSWEDLLVKTTPLYLKLCFNPFNIISLSASCAHHCFRDPVTDPLAYCPDTPWTGCRPWQH